jgi:hypothetical protein
MVIFPNAWNDKELLAILDETTIWTVAGDHGLILNVSRSLRAALEKAAFYSRSGVTVGKISRQPSENIMVLPAQIRRLATIIADLEQPMIVGRDDAPG